MGQRGLKPQTQYPDLDFRLPLDSRPPIGLDSKLGPNLQTLDQATLSSLDAVNVGQCGREAQLVSLLDRLLFVMHVTTSNKETKLAELAELDSNLRNFLEVAMGEPFCAPVAFCVR